MNPLAVRVIKLSFQLNVFLLSLGKLKNIPRSGIERSLDFTGRECYFVSR